jgi:hypothetical protein
MPTKGKRQVWVLSFEQCDEPGVDVFGTEKRARAELRQFMDSVGWSAKKALKAIDTEGWCDGPKGMVISIMSKPVL